MRARVLFFGSPAFALPSLEAVLTAAEIAGVVCQPDRPAGRGLVLTPPPVKTRAAELGLPVVQPTKLRTGDFARWVVEQRIDVGVVVAYGRILPGDVLAAPRLGCINVHASVLPKFRGAAPIAWSIVRGEHETGVTLMKLDEGMDTGPTFARKTTPIGPDETAGQLGGRLSRLGGEALAEWLPRYVEGSYTLEPQDAALATPAPILEREHGRIDWAAGPTVVHDLIRGMNPWPSAFTTARGRVVKVHEARPIEHAPTAEPGHVILVDKDHVWVRCGTGTLALLTVQPEGKRSMRATDWAMGRGVAEGDVLGR